MAREPYTGLYLRMDMRACDYIWRQATGEGSVVCSELNRNPPYSRELIRTLQVQECEVTDDAWACAGMVDVIFHVGRSIVALAARWRAYVGARAHLKLAKEQEVDVVYARVVHGISLALSLNPADVKVILGSSDDCQDVASFDIFPKMSWKPCEPRRSRVHLWSKVEAIFDEEDVDYAQNVTPIPYDSEREASVSDDTDEERNAYAHPSPALMNSSGTRKSREAEKLSDGGNSGEGAVHPRRPRKRTGAHGAKRSDASPNSDDSPDCSPTPKRSHRSRRSLAVD